MAAMAQQVERIKWRGMVCMVESGVSVVEQGLGGSLGCLEPRQTTPMMSQIVPFFAPKSANEQSHQKKHDLLGALRSISQLIIFQN
jgi:hypothetical protein